MGKLTRKQAAAGVLLIVIGLFNGVMFRLKKAPQPVRRSRRVSGASLAAAYQEAAADGAFRREMNEVVEDFDATLADEFGGCEPGHA